MRSKRQTAGFETDPEYQWVYTVAAEFSLSVADVLAMPNPVFVEHVAYLRWRGRKQEEEAEKASKKK